MIIVTFVDACILISKDKAVIQELICLFRNGPENFDFTNEGTLSEYLGVDISRFPNGGLFADILDRVHHQPTTI